MQNFLCSLFSVVPGLSDLGLFSSECSDNEGGFPAFATVVIVIITALGLFFR